MCRKNTEAENTIISSNVGNKGLKGIRRRTTKTNNAKHDEGINGTPNVVLKSSSTLLSQDCDSSISNEPIKVKDVSKTVYQCSPNFDALQKRPVRKRLNLQRLPSCVSITHSNVLEPQINEKFHNFMMSDTLPDIN